MHTDERSTSSVIKPVINLAEGFTRAILQRKDFPLLCPSFLLFFLIVFLLPVVAFFSCALLQDMSTYGGDSWVPEALHRKRRVDDLLADDIDDAQVRRLSNGRLACLVCPHCPVLDTVPMLLVTVFFSSFDSASWAFFLLHFASKRTFFEVLCLKKR